MHQFSTARFTELLSLDEKDASALAALRGVEVSVGRGQLIRAAGARVDDIYLLLDGWVLGAIDLPGGERQVVNVHLAGDVIGAPSMTLQHAAETLTAITAATIRRVALEDLIALLSSSPRLALAFLLSANRERVILMDRIASVGRTSAAQRLAAFLLHIYDRLMVLDPQRARPLDMPLTQLHIADVLGLTNVHVNRTFRELDGTGLIERAGSVVTIIDARRMRAFAGLPAREWVHDPAWASRTTKP